jgi:hypothetical protein
MAIVKAQCSAESLELCELIRLAEWIVQPPTDKAAWQWCQSHAVPIIRELGRRLLSQRSSQEVAIPDLLRQVKEMRDAQKTFQVRTNRAEAPAALRASIERERIIDQILANHFQPALFDLEGEEQ